MARVPYVLGIDVGRTRGTAAVCRRGNAGHGRAEVVPVDGGARWFPSVLFVAADGEVVPGRAALRRAEAEPDRLARAALDRVGDDTAVLLGGELYPAEALVAALVAWVVDTVAEAEGGDPDRIAVTHPPEWGPHRRRLLHEALHEAGLPGALLLPTVVAAAETRHARDPVPTGTALLVALVGAAHSEQAVLYRGPSAFDLTAHTAHPATAPGDHLDDLLAEHVLAATPTPAPDETVPDLRTAGPVRAADLPRQAMAAFREACTAAKERLSVATEVRVPLPHTPGDVTVPRTTFAELARPTLAAVADQVRSLLATVPPEHLAGAVLAGGTARVPLLADLAGCPVEEDPATSPARGAALAARPRPTGSPGGRAGRPGRPDPGSDPGFPPLNPGTGPGSHPGFAPLTQGSADFAPSGNPAPAGPGGRPGGDFGGPGSHPGFTPLGSTGPGGRDHISAELASHPGFTPLSGAGSPGNHPNGADHASVELAGRPGSGAAGTGSDPGFPPLGSTGVGAGGEAGPAPTGVGGDPGFLPLTPGGTDFDPAGFPGNPGPGGLVQPALGGVDFAPTGAPAPVGPGHPGHTPFDPDGGPGQAGAPGSRPGHAPGGAGGLPGHPGSHPGFAPVTPGGPAWSPGGPGHAVVGPGGPAGGQGPHSDPRLTPAVPGAFSQPSSPGLVPATAGHPGPPGHALVPATPGERRPDGLVLPARSVTAHLSADPLLAPRPTPAPPPPRQAPPPAPAEPPAAVDGAPDSDPPPPRPPVELTPLVPPPPRFTFPRRSRGEEDTR
ncbi:Hsp70 family protein [Actinokineospora spheciospongiae]|uniref:Hsp70 family protein n=1 Tax=Actinokineospora spheciospongiae TaxID=909613 RepID=UPI000D71B357|nr:Hsp70 family protein [Actinokineospora spheciospongiae]PWW64741.1 Hsp70 protein [Actinokineospora spheciospongiae]